MGSPTTLQSIAFAQASKRLFGEVWNKTVKLNETFYM
jgi:hypothetical protein